LDRDFTELKDISAHTGGFAAYYANRLIGGTLLTDTKANSIQMLEDNHQESL
jgi:hypothetical protein